MARTARKKSRTGDKQGDGSLFAANKMDRGTGTLSIYDLPRALWGSSDSNDVVAKTLYELPWVSYNQSKRRDSDETY